jgi:hypothetical protein
MTTEGSIRDSTRPENDVWGNPPSNLKGDECEPGLIQVVTTTAPTVYDLEITDVRDLPGGNQGGEVICSIEGTWVVDNSTIRNSVVQAPFSPFTLRGFGGEIRITFRADGTAEVVYDGFNWLVDITQNFTVGDIPIEKYEAFYRTIDAQGVTTYQVDGNEITFGTFLESDFLKGTETVVHDVRIDPENTIGPNIHEEYSPNLMGLALFSGFVNFGIQSNGSVLQWRFGDQVELSLNRVY